MNPSPSRRLLLGAVYPPLGAATRLRLGLAADAGRRIGDDVRTWTFLDDDDYGPWIAGGAGRLAGVRHARGAISRWSGLSASAAVAVVQRELLPVNSSHLERRFARSDRPWVWDVDDTVWVAASRPYAAVRGGLRKFAWMAAAAAEIWAGSQVIAEWCAARGAGNVHHVPTLPEAYLLDPADREDDLLVWVGTPATQGFLRAFLLDNAAALSGWRVLAVGGRLDPIPGIALACRPWSRDNERSALARATAGLYPIDTRIEYTKGKSALKALLYQAHGIPMIATDAPAVRAVFEPGSGCLVSSTGEVRDALAAVADEGSRAAMAAAALVAHARDYDRDAWAAWLAGRLSLLA